MSVGIYGIFNAETNECLYVGLSKNIKERWKSHIKLLRNKKHKRKDFVEWFHTHGAHKELLSFRILEECEYDEKILNLAEIKWFNELKPKFYGKKPAEGEKWEHSIETKKQIQQTIYANLGLEYKQKQCFFCQSPITTDAEKYCCVECAWEGMKKEKVECVICFTPINYNRFNKTCSKKCSAIFKSKSLSDKEPIDYGLVNELFYKQNMPVAKIAEKLKCSRQSIYNYIRKNK